MCEETEILFKTIIIPLCSSFIFFIIINSIIKPCLKISSQIKEISDNQFEFKIVNYSYLFNLTDIVIEYKITTPFDEGGTDIFCPQSPNNLPYLNKNQIRSKGKNNEIQITIMIPQEEIEGYIANKNGAYKHLENKEIITINDFLQKDLAFLEIIVLGYSGFTGVKKMYKSKPIFKEFISKDGEWKNKCYGSPVLEIPKGPTKA